MRFFTLLFIFLFSSIFVTTVAQDYIPNEAEINFKQSHWLLIKETKRSIVLKHPDNIATINIVHKKINEPLTANRLHQERAMSHYDGWLKVLSRASSDQELTLANVDDGYIALYVKQFLNSDLKINKRLVGEYYFIKDDRYIIVNIETKKSNWGLVQTDWKRFIDSFWIGQNIRPTYFKEPISNQDWFYNGNINNTSYIEAEIPVQNQLTLNWQLSFNDAPSLSNISYICIEEVIYLLQNNTISKIDSYLGKVIWEYTLDETISPTTLMFHASLLYVKTMGDQPSFVAISAESGEKIYSINLTNQYSSVIFDQQKGYLNDNGFLKLFSIHSGVISYTYPVKINPTTPLFLTSSSIIAQLETGEMAAIDKLSSDIIWKTQSCELAFSPTCSKDLLLTPIKTNDKTHRLVAFNLKDGSIQWSFNRDILNFSFHSSISTSDKFSIISGSITLPNGTRNNILAQINNSKGDINWETLLDHTLQRPIITPSSIFSVKHNTRELLILDPLTGDTIPQYTFFPLDSFLVFNKSLIVISVVDNQIQVKCFG